MIPVPIESKLQKSSNCHYTRGITQKHVYIYTYIYAEAVLRKRYRIPQKAPDSAGYRIYPVSGTFLLYSV